MSGPAVLVEGIAKSFGKVRALRGIDLSVPYGSVLGVLGPNGAGKTTTVRVLTTLLRPDSGRALVDGRDVVSEAAAVRRVIGLAGQSPAVQEELTGRENLEIIGRLHRLGRAGARARTDELLTEFGLGKAADRPAKTYSGGMQRRLDLAASLIGRPTVLFLDEPTSALDPTARLALWNLVRELVVDGTTVLLTTQYLEEADALADRIAVIDRGRVIALDSPEQLKSRVGGDVLEFVVGDRGALSDAVAAVRGLSDTEPRVDAESGRVALAVGTDGAAAVVDVVRRLDAAHVTIDGLTVRRPSLDDVFVALTGSGGPAEPTAHTEENHKDSVGALREGSPR